MFIYKAENNLFFSENNMLKSEEILLENNNKICKIEGVDGIFKSASITFYCKGFGFLLCKELRDNKLVLHPIGGKYEEYDETIEKTACREFIEETGILENSEFIDLLEKDENKSNEEKGIKLIYNLLLNNDITSYYDYYVNKDKKYIHRYYLVNVDLMEIKVRNVIKKLKGFYKKKYGENINEYIYSLQWNTEIIKNSVNLDRKKYSALTLYLATYLQNVK